MTSPVVGGVYRIDTWVSGTLMPLALYLIDGEGSDWLLTDTGCRGQVASLVIPALADLAPGSRVGTGVVCHAHADHFGGNAELLAANPRCRIVAHEADVRWARDPEWHLADAYGALEPEYGLSEEDRAWLARLLGPPTPVHAVKDGHLIRVGTRSLLVVHLPGHSPGHIGLWDAEHELLLASDAILGDGQWADGRLAAIPSYLDVAQYRSSIERVRQLEPRVLATAHFPLFREEEEVEGFCRLSEAFVDALDLAVEGALSDREPRALRQLTTAAVSEVAPGVAPSYTAALSVRAHLRGLRARGVAMSLGSTEADGERWMRT